METPKEMNAAIEGLNGEEFVGRALTINEARSCEERPKAALVIILAVATVTN